MAGENYKTSPFSLLPEGCIANIISLTSPQDACRAAAVSLGFKSAAESDTVWERFLPHDYQEILSRSRSPVAFSSKKQLFCMLCHPGILLDEDKLSFGLSRSTGKKCYMLRAGELRITWGDTPAYWRKIPLPESRFVEVAELLAVCLLEIRGEFQAKMLSPNTNYAAYLVYKISENHYGLDSPAKAWVRTVSKSTESSKVYIVPPRQDEDGWLSRSRTDGWLEMKLGEIFITEGEASDVEIHFLANGYTPRANWKTGLIVEGIELRPKEAF